LVLKLIFVWVKNIDISKLFQKRIGLTTSVNLAATLLRYAAR
jgi:hypothetical protein